MVLLLAVAFRLNTAMVVEQKKGEEYVVADGSALALNYVRCTEQYSQTL